MKILFGFIAISCTSFFVTALNAQQNSVWTGLAFDNNWGNASNWTNGVPDDGVSSYFNAIIDQNEATNSTVHVFDGDSFTVDQLEIDEEDSLTISGSLFIGTDTGPSNNGLLLNYGNVAVDSGVLYIQNNVSLIGSGEIRLGGSTDDNSISGLSGSGNVLVNSSRIVGHGRIGKATSGSFSRLGLVNESNGLISADQAGKSLDITPSSLSNQGTLQAKNGGQLLIDSGDLILNNSGGVIESLDGSTVLLTGDTFIDGGIVRSLGSGVVKVDATVNDEVGLSNLTLQGRIDVGNRSEFYLSGVLDNQSKDFNIINTETSASSSNATYVHVNDDLTLIGGGSISLKQNSGLAIVDETKSNSNVTVNNVDNLIEGNGVIRGGINWANETAGAIVANDASGSIYIQLASDVVLRNEGRLAAENGGTLVLDSTVVDNMNGVIEASDGSRVEIMASSIGSGTIRTTGNGQVEVIGTGPNTIQDATVFGNFVIADGGRALLKGALLNRSQDFVVSNSGGTASLRISGEVLLNGGGTISLVGDNETGSLITGDGFNLVDHLINTDNSLRGFGRIGGTSGGLKIETRESASISADVLGKSLQFVSEGGNTNNGTFEAINGGHLVVGNQFIEDFSNHGRVTAGIDSLVTVDGVFTNEMDGLISGNGTVEADVLRNGGLIAPGESIGTLSLLGDIEFLNSSVLEIELNQDNSDLLSIHGAVLLDGVLSLDFTGSGSPSESDVFTVLVSDALNGSFLNAANGDRLSASNGSGTFVVNYGSDSAFASNSVVLSNFAAVPEPGSAALLLILGLVLVSKRSDRRDIDCCY